MKRKKLQTMEHQWRNLEKRRPNLGGKGRRGIPNMTQQAIAKEII